MAWKIGELARLAECSVVTVRYYEKKGLLPQAERTAANYRLYGPKDLERLDFIRHCRSHDMSIEEIRGLMALAEAPGVQCESVHRMLREHIAGIEAQIASLEKLKASLETILSQCHGVGRICEALKSLGAQAACASCRYNQVSQARNRQAGPPCGQEGMAQSAGRSRKSG